METDEDAALVDSFFLPGGILDPDDEDDTPVPSVSPLLNTGGISRVPSNPWRDDFMQRIGVERSQNLRSGRLGMTIQSPPPSNLPQLNNYHFHRNPIGPPPGYTENDRLTLGTNGLGSTPTKNQPAENDILLNNNTHVSSFPGMDPLMAGRRKNSNIQALQILNRTIQRQASTRLCELPQWESSNLTLKKQDIKKQYASTSDQSTTSNDDMLDGAFGSKSSTNLIIDFSLPTTLLEKDTEGRACVGDHGKGHASVQSDSMIPLELVSIRGIYKGDSLASSLSVSTCGSVVEDTSHAEESDEEDDESEIAGGNESEGSFHCVGSTKEQTQSLTVLQKNDKKSPQNFVGVEPSPITCKSTRESKIVLANPDSASWNPWSTARSFLYRLWAFVLFHFATAFCLVNKNFVMLLSRYVRTFTTISLDISVSVHQFVDTCQTAQQILMDTKDVTTDLLAGFLRFFHTSLMTISRSVKLGLVIILQLWKFSIFEAFEEFNVSMCYIIFYCMPSCCSLLMNKFNVPHWTSHLLTATALYSMSSQVRAGTLHTNFSALINGNNNLVQSMDVEAFGKTHARDERACKTILYVQKLVLPVFFLVDGFSTEFGTVMGISDASRLTTAFMMSLVRKNMISSPIGWISWAIQIIVATSFPSSLLSDHIVLIVGLSSIRLIRYLDFQRLVNDEKRSCKNN